LRNSFTPSRRQSLQTFLSVRAIAVQYLAVQWF